MTTPTEVRPETRSTARKFVWLGLGVVAAIGLWTALWSYAAERMEAQLPVLFARGAEDGLRASCANPEVRGYPFRLGLFCDATEWEIPARQIRASTSAFRSAAQFYRPGHVVSELDGPLIVSGPEGAVRIDWQVMHGSTVMRLHGLDRASLEGRMLSVDLDSSALPAKVSLTASVVALHMRANDQDLELAGSAEAIQASFGPKLAARSLRFAVTLPGQSSLFAASGSGRLDLAGQTVLVALAEVVLENGGQLALNGQVEFGPDGLATGDFKLTMSDVSALASAVGGIDPDIASQIRALAPVLAALDTQAGDDAITLPLSLVNGTVRIGILPLGTLPPV